MIEWLVVNIWDLFWTFLILWSIAAVIVIAVITIDNRRRGRKLTGGYPRIEFDELEIDGNRVQLYMAGPPVFDDMLDAIRNAQEKIYFETFIWKDDPVGQEFRDLLVAKAREGVDVYCVWDRIANGLLAKGIKELPTDIPTLHWFRFMGWRRWWDVIRPSQFNATHRKIIIVDDNIGFVGGYNCGEEYRDEWRDTHIRVQGSMAVKLSHAFTDLWNLYRKPKDNPQLPHPDVRFDPIVNVDRNDPARKNYPIRSTYLSAIELAREKIIITNAYFVPDPPLRKALFAAAERGIEIHVVLPWQSNHIINDWVARQRFRQYLVRGIRLYGYQKSMIHTKTVTIDGEWSLIGTANLDRMSMWMNQEINIGIYSEVLAAQMEQIFEVDKRNSKEIILEEWDQRPWTSRLGELVLAPLWPLF